MTPILSLLVERKDLDLCTTTPDTRQTSIQGSVFYDGSVFNAAIGHLSEHFESSGDSQRWEGCETATLQPGVAGEETKKLTFYSIQQLYPQYGIFGVGSNSLDISVF